MNARLIEQARPVILIDPLNDSGAAEAGPWISMANYRRAMILIEQGAWAGGTPAVTINQAKDASGTGSKALPFDTMFQSTASADVPVTNAVTGNTFNLPNQPHTLTAIELNVQDFDVTNGFKFFQLNIASPGNNADLVAAQAILYEAAHSTKPDLGLSVLS